MRRDFDENGDRTVVKVFGGTVRRFIGGDSFLWKNKYLFTCDSGCRD